MNDGTGVFAPPTWPGAPRAAGVGFGTVAGHPRERLQGQTPMPVPSSRYRRPTMDGDWALHSHLDLGALPGAVPSARLHTRHLLWEWGIGGLAEDAELIVSELITNAVNASRNLPQFPPVRLRLESDRKQLLILVWDAIPDPPVLIDPDATAENGRGLLLVEALPSQWGSYNPEAMAGKVVWALLTT
jgi:anti-sigma regulatory factor (Ser/Thr protein kinase)